MEIAELLKLFRKANKLNGWGEFTELVFFDDGTGEVKVGGEIIFAFGDVKELVGRLREETNTL